MEGTGDKVDNIDFAWRQLDHYSNKLRIEFQLRATLVTQRGWLTTLYLVFFGVWWYSTQRLWELAPLAEAADLSSRVVVNISGIVLFAGLLCALGGLYSMVNAYLMSGDWPSLFRERSNVKSPHHAWLSEEINSTKWRVMEATRTNEALEDRLKKSASMLIISFLSFGLTLPTTAPIIYPLFGPSISNTG